MSDDAGQIDAFTAQVAQLQAERDDLRAIVSRLQDDILHKDETLALVERNRPVEAAFTLAKVMRECREANGQIAALQAERDEARAERDKYGVTMDKALQVGLHLTELRAQLATLTTERDALRAEVKQLSSDEYLGDLAKIARDELAEVKAERDALKRDGLALVKQFENVARALNDIGWPSQNALATERACDALHVLSGTNKSGRLESERLRAMLVEACDLADRGWHSAGEALGFDGAHPHKDRIAALRSAAEGAGEG